MNAEALAQLDRIKRYSLSLRRLFVFLFFATLLAAVVTLISLGSMLASDPAADGAVTLRRTVELGSGLAFEWNTAPLTVRVLALAYFAAVFAAALLLLHHLAKLFGLYAGGKIFTGLIVIFISWVMDVGRRLREENDLVV
jgi:hypothetical protein